MADDQRWFEKHAPEMAEGWWQFYKACEGETKLDTNTKALIAHCVESRIKKALSLKISKAEIAETIMETALLSSGTDIFWAKDVYDKYLD